MRSVLHDHVQNRIYLHSVAHTESPGECRRAITETARAGANELPDSAISRLTCAKAVRNKNPKKDEKSDGRASVTALWIDVERAG